LDVQYLVNRFEQDQDRNSGTCEVLVPISDRKA
jgi:hypothetical protein